MTVIPYFIAKGIPKRIGATRCLLGTLRGPETLEPDDTTTEYDNVTGCSPRNPEHGVVGSIYEGETEEENYAMVTAMTPYSSYPSTLPLSTDDEGTHLVIKARGEIQRDMGSGEWQFPKLKLTIRPLKSVLDYRWFADATRVFNYNSVTNYGGNYEEDAAGESVWYDFDIAYDYYGAPFDVNNIGSLNAAREVMRAAFVERGTPLFLKGDFYYKMADAPPNTPSEYAQPLEPQEIDLNLYPRADGEEPYEFKRNESWDLRYRFPFWWNFYGGGVRYQYKSDLETPGYYWVWSQPTELASSNPHSYQDNTGFPDYTPFTNYYLAPVSKFLRIQDGSPPSYPIGPLNDYIQGVSDKAFPDLWERHHIPYEQVVTKVRKRYSFSFETPKVRTDASTNTGGSFQIIDQNPANAQVYSGTDPEGNPESSLFRLVEFQRFFACNSEKNGEAAEDPIRFKCEAWWRMEIDTERCEWNFDEKLDEGWTIKGFVEFGNILLKEPILGQADAVKGYQYGTDFFFPQFIWRSNGVAPIPAFEFYPTESEDGEEYPYAPAGRAEFTVKVTKDNAIGKPVTVLDFPVGGTTYVPDGSGGFTPVHWGQAPERSMVFITDFYITEIIPPAPPGG